MPLTAKLIDSLKPKPKTYLVADGSVPGFSVKVLPSGVRSYVYRYTVAGVAREMTIGRTTAIKPDVARDIATKHYLAVRGGEDPMGSRTNAGSTMTIASLYDEYMQSKAFKPNTVRNYNYQANRYIKPLLGKYLISLPDLDARITDVHYGMRAKPAAANSLLKILRSMFEYAVERKWVAATPVSYKRHQEVEYNTTMSVEEAGAVWAACDQYVARNTAAGRKWAKIGHAFQLLLATGARKSEMMYHLEWDHITEERIVIPWQLIKTGGKKHKDLVIYQTDLTRDILAKLPKESQYVFGIGDSRFDATTEATTEWRTILKLAGITDRRIRIHDIRHTVASLLGDERTMTLKDCGMMLNHSSQRSTERYVKHFDTAKEDVTKRAAAVLTRVYTGGQHE